MKTQADWMEVALAKPLFLHFVARTAEIDRAGITIVRIASWWPGLVSNSFNFKHLDGAFGTWKTT
ncbi:hypothetical protein [Comamonas serinivorans]|uniref:hypothetical protein n=1 Tax=Comamonas serinivorans TaxID=1082851 RepID=UPI0012FAE49C|nr:hypothetical protein [Comamonas serinivorans]